GKQDQYMAAYGGIHHVQFNPDDSVFVHPILCSQAIKQELCKNSLLFFTGVSRNARIILEEQKAESSKQNKVVILREMRNLAVEIKECLIHGDLDEFGKLLHKGWMLKKSLASSITNDKIDAYYNQALSAGAAGGKILGAGGGGFLLLYCPKEKQPKVREALNDLTLTEFSLEPEGSKIIYVI
ncbi:GHMP kinase, partial [bacterium]|nr:GHMP kinase [bacterium]